MTRLFVVNVLLGIPGILYFWMLSIYIAHGSEVFSFSASWLENVHGYFSSNLVLGPPLAIGAILWIFVNAALVKRRMRAGHCQNATGKTAHWITAGFSTMLIPALFLGLAALG